MSACIFLSETDGNKSVSSVTDGNITNHPKTNPKYAGYIKGNFFGIAMAPMNFYPG